MSYIVFLHQTTTVPWCVACVSHCLISSFYIKPQHDVHGRVGEGYCLISSFYIKPQRSRCSLSSSGYCLISSFYIKPQLIRQGHRMCLHCLISSFYIKPQPRTADRLSQAIVLYRLSTSNHNFRAVKTFNDELSYIVFLHQTTTAYALTASVPRLSYIVFLHQTTT